MKKNILIVASKFPPEYSGPGVRIMRLYSHFKEQGRDMNVQVFCNGIEHLKNERYDYQGFPVRRITARIVNTITYLLFLSERLKTLIVYQAEFIKSFFVILFDKQYRQADLIHLFGNSGGTAATLLFARLFKIPVLMELVTALARPHQKIFKFITIKLPARSKIIALTQNAADASEKMGYSSDQIWCRPNPIKEDVFSYKKADQKKLRSEVCEFKEGDIVLGNVAKFMPQKNQLLIVEILRHLPDNYKAIIGGPFVQEGPLYERDKNYTETIEAKISEYALDDRIQLTFDYVAADQYMKASDVYLMPAWDEGFGTPMMEAMACGVPVIANKDEHAFQEWVKDGENGYLCDIEKPEDWAEAIQKMAQLSHEQKKSISQHIHKKAGQSVIYKEYERIIDELLAL